MWNPDIICLQVSSYPPPPLCTILLTYYNETLNFFLIVKYLQEVDKYFDVSVIMEKAGYIGSYTVGIHVENLMYFIPLG